MALYLPSMAHFRAFRRLLHIFALFLTLTSLARADFYLHPWQDFHEDGDTALLSAELFYYSTGSNFYSGLSSSAPAGFNQYNRIENDDVIQYGLTDRLSLFGRLTWMRAQVSSTPDTTFYPGTAFGLGDQTVGASYRIYGPGAGRLSIDLQLQVDFPAYSNSASAQDMIPFLGDGSVDTTLGAFGDLPLLSKARYDLKVVGGAGYTYRTAGFSAAIPWSVEARASFGDAEPGSTRSFGPSVGLGFNGIQSLQTDSRQPLGTPLEATTGAGGSFIVNAVNPSIVNVNADAGYAIRNGMRLTAFGQYSVAGQNAPDGFAAGLAFQTRFGRTPASSKGEGEGESENEGRGGADTPSRSRGAADPGSWNPGAYNLQAAVTAVNDRFNVLKIDKGTHDGVEVGDLFDLFAPVSTGKPRPAIARARVTQVKDDEAALQVDEYYRDTWIDKGFTARRLSQ